MTKINSKQQEPAGTTFMYSLSYSPLLLVCSFLLPSYLLITTKISSYPRLMGSGGSPARSESKIDCLINMWRDPRYLSQSHTVDIKQSLWRIVFLLQRLSSRKLTRPKTGMRLHFHQQISRVTLSALLKIIIIQTHTIFVNLKQSIKYSFEDFVQS